MDGNLQNVVCRRKKIQYPTQFIFLYICQYVMVKFFVYSNCKTVGGDCKSSKESGAQY